MALFYVLWKAVVLNFIINKTDMSICISVQGLCIDAREIGLWVVTILWYFQYILFLIIHN